MADRVHELKETEKGVEHMCKEMEALRLEGVEEGRLEEKKETARNLNDMGLPIEQIAQALKVNVQLTRRYQPSCYIYILQESRYTFKTWIFPVERTKSCGSRGVAGVWGSAPFQQSPCI